MSHNLRIRVISGIVIGAITIGAGLLGGIWWAGYLLGLAIRAADEMIALVRASGYRPGRLVALLVAASAFLAVWLRWPLATVGAIASALMLGSLAVQLRRREGSPTADWALTLASGGYVGWCAGHLALLRDTPNGLAWVIVAIGATWLADSAAYLVGSRFGRRKLAPDVSPKKTWEGYLGGVLAAILGGVVFGFVVPEIGPAKAIPLAMAAGALGTLGDLSESMFKRQAHEKDSGDLIPGHGGVFDRMDSVLWTGVVVYYGSLFLGQ
ncbi:MAG: phosphatidate cytidylyltransferase [Anaerolineae bacterium]|nr:phosphatidate cytidylyltransferase [Anaerolineae bacterium]